MRNDIMLSICDKLSDTEGIAVLVNGIWFKGRFEKADIPANIIMLNTVDSMEVELNIIDINAIQAIRVYSLGTAKRLKKRDLIF